MLPFDIFNSAWSVLEDIVIWLLPIPTVYYLRLPLRRKLWLYALLAISLISVGCAITRMVFVIVWVRSSDISWNYPLIPFVSNMEACVALMTTSFPALFPLFRSRTPRRTIHPALPPTAPASPRDAEKQASEKVESVGSHSTNNEWDSRDGTAVPSTANQTDRNSGSLSLLSKFRPSTVMSKRASGFRDSNGPISTYRSETEASGPRTELKDLDEVGEGVVPGLRQPGRG